ncbi:MAG: lipase family protein [bacterium]|nr:lipase family protein [bacterium]
MATAVAFREEINVLQVAEPISRFSLLRKSLLFAELSKIAYYRPTIAAAAAAAMGFEYCRYFDRDGAQAYIMGNQHDYVVVCRGTEPSEWNDIRADLNAFMAMAETVGRVHRGFKQEVDDLWPRLEIALRENDKPLWFTGHSLGGAMATICAGRCKLAEIASNPEGLFTFGSPRVGDRRYINFVKIPHYRWVNNNDIVCRVPPRWLGYKHSGQEMYLDSQGNYRRISTWGRFWDRLRGTLMGMRSFEFDQLADHSMTRYIQYIQRAVDGEEQSESRPGKYAIYPRD